VGGRNRAASYFPGGEYFEQVHKAPVLSTRERAETRAVEDFSRFRSESTSQGRERTFTSYGKYIHIYIYIYIAYFCIQMMYLCCIYLYVHVYA
jgi:hypothetical protein